VSGCGCTTAWACPVHALPEFTNTAGTRPVVASRPASCTQCNDSRSLFVDRGDKRSRVRVACFCAIEVLANKGHEQLTRIAALEADNARLRAEIDALHSLPGPDCTPRVVVARGFDDGRACEWSVPLTGGRP